MLPAKILTVSYGSFSCTLEGFDDPYSTMMAVAEYFRDLAADDRAFGGNLPPPDLARLRALAEGRARHPVDTHLRDGGLVMRRGAAETEDVTGTAVPSDAALRADDPIDSTEDAAVDLAQVESGEMPPSEPDAAAPVAAGGVERSVDSDAGLAAAKIDRSDAASPHRIRRAEDRAAATDPGGTPDAPLKASAQADGSDAEKSDLPGDGARNGNDPDILGVLSFDDDDSGEVDEDAESGPMFARGKAGHGTPAQDTATRATPPIVPDMERLFAATDSRLSGEDTSRRHANISHLKAAVAARRADGPVDPDATQETDAYRADLASSVRPRRTLRPTELPRRERPAPLMLVSEQRVGDALAQDEAPAAPVQPRRAARPDEADMQAPAMPHTAGTEDFERFASELGATDVPDILEAAAAYIARVMGQETFTRPGLLHLAAEACDDLSREDGLRGFGQLLRDGRIRKVDRGIFALAVGHRDAVGGDRRIG